MAGPAGGDHLWAVSSANGGSVTTLGLPATGLVWTTKVAVLVPGCTPTRLSGTVAMAVLLLSNLTCTPPAPASPLSVTITVTGAPPITLG